MLLRSTERILYRVGTDTAETARKRGPNVYIHPVLPFPEPELSTQGTQSRELALALNGMRELSGG